MPLTVEQKKKIEDVVKASVRQKIEKYSPETSHMPFHYRLVGKDRMALFSFIQSLNTTFGTSIFQPVAEVLAAPNFAVVQREFVTGTKLSKKAQAVIQDIINELSIGIEDPCKPDEIHRIREVCNKGKMKNVKPVKADLFVQSTDQTIHLFDLKTAKLNISNFKDFKRTLLEWVAIQLAKNRDANIQTYIAIPYNPYSPLPYKRWTMKGMLDLNYELKVDYEFWNFLGNDDVYDELLNCFRNAGLQLREEIDQRFSRFDI